MAKDQLRDLHSFAMESALPFGMGFIKNVKTGGLKKVMGVLRSKDPILEFQVEGETSAKNLRDKIDQVFPGLGYPVVSVEVTVEDNVPNTETYDQDSLLSTLKRIDSQLDHLRHLISNDSNT
tara:strand:- start:640 stop:1005 length:366 start_codon:yes stop_codon:yes gene_type:complete